MAVQFSETVRNFRLDAMELAVGGIVDGTCSWAPMGAGTGTAWAGSTAYTVGQLRSNGGNLFLCVKAGTSASSGGPTGTSQAAPTFRIYSGAPPANCATAFSGTLLLTMNLPADFMVNAATGSKALNGSWSANASVAGVAGYYRIYDNAGTICHEQGTCGLSATDLILDNTNLGVGQTVNITTFTKTDGNA